MLLESLGLKVWIQRDFTEEGVASELVELGVPKTDMVLGFKSH
ncbi:MAG: XisI protein [Aphanizomenon flos-aquae Clear-A1]|nr:XisI protein [Aphanizomenon flos-aquae Clear-A1]